jgi:hypothetical protein
MRLRNGDIVERKKLGMKLITQLKLPHKIKSGGEKKVHDKN